MEETVEPPTETTKADSVPDAAAVTQASDIHRTKISPDDPRLRLDRARSRTLRRGPVLAAFFAVGGLVAVALVAALAGSPTDRGERTKESHPPAIAPTPQPLPDVIKDAPVASGVSVGKPSGRPNGPLSDAGVGPPQATQAETLDRQVSHEAFLRARAAGVFSAMDDSVPAVQASQSEQGRRGDPGRDASASPAPPVPQTADPNLQERKNSFLAKEGIAGAEYLEKSVTAPRSPFEVKAGTVIPAVLLSGINSDLPGKIVAQVRENVYDTVTGNHLLIPQGSRLLAAYDSMVVWGQERVLVCWNRLIRPDGSSIALDCMPGVDLAGYAGFADEVDNHWLKIIGGVVFSSVLAATAQRSQGDVSGYQPTVGQLWASNAAGQINQAGQQLTQKNLQIQPTLTVRPGFAVNVLVTKDIVIDPPKQEGAAP